MEDGWQDGCRLRNLVVDRMDQQLSMIDLMRMVMEGETKVWVEDEGEGGRGVVEGVAKDVGEDMGEDVTGREEEVEMDEEYRPLPPHLSSSQIDRI